MEEGEGIYPLIFGCLLEHDRDSFGIDSLSYTDIGYTDQT